MKKILLSLATATISLASFAQCTDLYFSEYIEGSSNNKAIEIYNPTSTAIDLSNYTIYRYNNGNTSASGTFNMVGMLNAGDVYVIANSSSVAAITGVADTLHSICGFNGDDALELYNGTTQIDGFGVLGVDPGSSWPVGTGSTQNHTLVRKVTVDEGNITWTGSGDLEWDVYSIDDFSLLGSHTANGCGTPSTDPIISFDGNSVPVNEAVGSVTIDLTLTNQSTLATSVDVVVSSSSTVASGDYTFTNPTTVTFPANSTNNQTITVTITDDMDIESAEYLTLELQNFTNNAAAGTHSMYEISILDNDEPVIAECSELYFSEYIEGSSSNKAIEIYNPTNQAVDLSNYIVYRSNNGASTPSDTLELVGTLNPGEVYIAAHASSDSAGIRSKADTLHSICYFNGDDALSLFNGTTQVDVLGVVGTDPGASWPVGTGSTANYTLVRNAAVVNGTTLWVGVGETQWTAHSIDDFSFIGSHTTDGCAANLPVAIPMADDNTICKGGTVNFTEASTGGAAPYSYDWDFGDGSTHATTATTSHVYTTAGTYNVTLTITDQSFVGQVDDSTIVITVDACSSINEEEENIILVYPNPSKDGLVNLSNVEANSTVTVFNVIGEVVFSTIASNNQQLNLSSLNKGSYFVTIANNNKSITKKLIIE